MSYGHSSAQNAFQLARKLAQIQAHNFFCSGQFEMLRRTPIQMAIHTLTYTFKVNKKPIKQIQFDICPPLEIMNNDRSQSASAKHIQYISRKLHKSHKGSRLLPFWSANKSVHFGIVHSVNI